jgi:hypothetical protein
MAPNDKKVLLGWQSCIHSVTSVHLSVQCASISIQAGYICRYDGQCIIICTAFSHGMFHCSRNKFGPQNGEFISL